MKLPNWAIALLVLAAAVACAIWFIRGRIGQIAELAYPKAAVMPADVEVSMEEVLDRLEAALSKSAPEILAALEPGITERQLAELEERGGFQLSPELRALYRWRNGMAPGSAADFIPGHDFLPLEQVIEERQSIAQQAREGTAAQRAMHELFSSHRDPWLTLLADGAGDGYFFDPQRRAGEGAIFYHFSETGHYVFFPSAKNLLVGIAECYETGAFAVSPEGRIVERYGEAEAVWKKYGQAVSP